MINEAIKKAKTPEEMKAELQKVYNLKSFQSLSHSIASKFITLANAVNAKTWRKASLEASKGRQMYEELHKVLNTTQVGIATNQKILENANLIKTLPLDISKQVTAFIGSKAFEGIRSKDTAALLHDKIYGYANARASLIARTETSKAFMALNEARSLDVGIDWYIWRTANDGLRVREAHRHMRGVLCRFKEPPASEELNGQKSEGHYNAGEIYNCRCFAQSLIFLNDVTWPAKVHINGKIISMTRLEFETMNPSYSKKQQAAKPAAQPKVPKVINPKKTIAPKPEPKMIIPEPPMPPIIAHVPEPVVAATKFTMPDIKLPTAAQLTKVSDGSYLGGAGQKSIYATEDGDKFIFKPAVTKSGQDAEFKAYVQEAAAKVQKLLNPNSHVPVTIRKLDGKTGTIQPLIKGKSINPEALKDFQENYEGLTQDQLKNLQREHVTDWLLCNFDGHYKNFIQDENGQWIGIDKEQSFRYIDEAGAQKMSVNYHPNMKYGENEPIYNEMYRRFEFGAMELDLKHILPLIEQIEAIPDKEYRENFRAFAESRHGKTQKTEDLLDNILERKIGIRKEYERFFSILLTQKYGQEVKFKFDQPLPEIKPKQETKPTPVASILPIPAVIPEKKVTKAKKAPKADVDFVDLRELPALKEKLEDFYYNLWKDRKKFSAEELDEGIRPYTGDSYTRINDALRKNSISEAHNITQNEIKKIDESFKKVPPFPADITIYRRISTSSAERLFPQLKGAIRNALAGDKETIAKRNEDFKLAYAKKVIGSDAADKAYGSSCYIRGAYASGKECEIQISIPKGSRKVIMVDSISKHSGEKEAILNRGVTMHVTDVWIEEDEFRRNEGGVLVIKAYIDPD